MVGLAHLPQGAREVLLMKLRLGEDPRLRVKSGRRKFNQSE